MHVFNGNESQNSLQSLAPHPSTKELLNKQIDQITDLKLKIAELQEALQDRVKKSEKYKQYYER